MERKDGRAPDAKRALTLVPGFTKHAEGSVLVELGDTRVLCTASVEEKVPPHLRDKAQGWVTAEYSMLPRSTETRTPRDSARGGVSGRSHEIQRLIGRSLRAGTILELLGERTIWVDCDVLQADGGTRVAAITGGFVALADALRWLYAREIIDAIPLKCFVAAISVGKVDGVIVADLSYGEDSRAEVDFNIVMSEFGDFVEVQGTAEGDPYSRRELFGMIDLAEKGITSLITLQKSSLKLSEEEERALGVARDRFRERQQA